MLEAEEHGREDQTGTGAEAQHHPRLKYAAPRELLTHRPNHAVCDQQEDRCPHGDVTVRDGWHAEEKPVELIGTRVRNDERDAGSHSDQDDAAGDGKGHRLAVSLDSPKEQQCEHRHANEQTQLLRANGVTEMVTGPTCSLDDRETREHRHHLDDWPQSQQAPGDRARRRIALHIRLHG